MVYLRLARMVFDFHNRNFMFPCDWEQNIIVDVNAQPWLIDLGHMRYYDKDRDVDFSNIFFSAFGKFLKEGRGGKVLVK